jgi:hypothetical protein
MCPRTRARSGENTTKIYIGRKEEEIKEKKMKQKENVINIKNN